MEESLEILSIHSAAGQTLAGPAVFGRRPVRAPHHTISDVGLLGGGAIPGPGEISLAHHGVLFLDELPEFKRGALEVLRQPLEDGQVSISRSAGKVSCQTPGCPHSGQTGASPAGHSSVTFTISISGCRLTSLTRQGSLTPNSPA